MSEEEVAKRQLPDLVKENLDILIVSIIKYRVFHMDWVDFIVAKVSAITKSGIKDMYICIFQMISLVVEIGLYNSSHPFGIPCT